MRMTLLMSTCLLGIGAYTSMSAGIPAASDPETGTAVLARVRAAARKASSLKATLAGKYAFRGLEADVSGRISLQKPDRYFSEIRLTRPEDGTTVLHEIKISDGKRFVLVRPATKQFSTTTRLPDLRKLTGLVGGFGLEAAFFNPDDYPGVRGPLPAATPAKVGQVAYQLLTFTQDPDQSQKVYVGPRGLPERVELGGTRDGVSERREIQWTDLKLDIPFNAGEFDYTPPADFKELQLLPRQTQTQSRNNRRVGTGRQKSAA